MGLFGGGGGTATTDTTTTVSPQDYITSMLQEIAGYAENINPGSYIQHKHAGFNPTETSALSMMAQSSGLRNLGNLLAPLADTGATVFSDVGRALDNILAGGATITPAMIESQGNQLEHSALANSNTQAVANTVGEAASALGASSSAAGNASRNLSNSSALAEPKKEEGYQNMAKGLLTGDQSALTKGLKQAGSLGQTMIGEGKTGVSDIDKAISNELKAGTLQQKETQKEYNNSWENAMGKELFPWEHADNMLNTLNKISKMAGYTTHTHSERNLAGLGKMKGLGEIAGIAKLAMEFI